MAFCYTAVVDKCIFVLFLLGLCVTSISTEELYKSSRLLVNQEFRINDDAKTSWSPPVPSDDFSHHTIVRPKLYHGREKRQISTTREDDGLHLHSLTIGYVSEGIEHILDLRLNRELIPADFFVRYQHNGEHVVNKPTGKDLELCHYVGVVRDLPNSWAAISTCKGLRGVVYDGAVMHYLQPTNDDSIESDHFLYKHHDLVTKHKCGYESGSNSSHHEHPHQHSTPPSTAEGLVMDGKHSEFNRILRYKRQASDEPKIRGPYNANKLSRYVELVLVVDNKEYKELGESLGNVHHHCKDIANIINSLYAPLNIFIALIGVVVWTEYDEISLSNNGDTTLTNFLHYRRERLVKDHPNDNAQLLTREQFVGGVVGKALKGPICTFEFSGGVAMDHSNVVGLVATTVAHEMGHNFGMEHDTVECRCPEERCIMSPSSNALSPTHWSSCSLEYLALAFEHGMDYCLRNKPTRLFDSPVCGNGFVESGEQCDCGLSGGCGDNRCCDPATCMLFPNATCATGECCDLLTCRPSTAGTMCRSADHECDLPEYCTGQSEFCPDDVFKMDTETCDHGKAFCYHGSCRTRSDQCQLLWGPSGESSDDQCYEMNKKGSRHGNCGYNRLKQHFSTCQEENVFCGMLHCRHLNERLEFGMESVAILSHSFINSRGSIIPCRTAIVDLGLNQVDPGLVPDGAKCGEGKMCVNQKCMAVASLRLGAQSRTDSGAVCPSDCSGHGVCNSLGHCHCEEGFAPPLCKLPGPGGSLDSGPASNPNTQKLVTIVLFIAFLGVVPAILFILCIIYYSRQNSFWMKPKGPTSKSPTKSNMQRGISRPSCFGLSSPSPPSSTSPLSNTVSANALSPDDMNSSLLPSQARGDIPSLNGNFFGQFKGFTLFPMQKRDDSFGTQNLAIINEQNPVSSFTSRPTSPVNTGSVKNAVNTLNRNASQTAQINRTPSFNNSPKSPNNSQKFPQRSAPPVPSVPSVTIKIPNVHRSNTQANDIKRSVTLDRSVTDASRPKSIASGVENANSASVAPALPPLNPGQHNTRPVISNPILEASTCTAKELISPLKNSSGSGGSVVVPLRAAPTVPQAMSPTASKRPLSSPNSTTNAVFAMPEEPAKKPKEGNTLNRIASFLKQDKSAEKSKISVERSNSLPKNPNHQVKIVKNIDKNALRNLQISNPILQKDIDLPSTTVPVISDSEDLDDPAKMVVMRAQSMRGPALAPRPNIPTFGSMRQPPGVKRPTSIPVGNRPTSPPPPRPTDLPGKIINSNTEAMKKIPGMPGYQNPPVFDRRNLKETKSPEYDDCVAESHAPLANISEETSPDNIYAIIEESPPSNAKKPAVIKPNPLSPPNKQAIPDKSGNLASDSMGLLGEIVSEIQNRNLESIYSTSTLARKKKEKEMREKKGLASEEDFDDNLHYKSPTSEYSNMNGAKSMSSAASTTSSGYLNPSAVNVPVGKIPPKSGIVSIDRVDGNSFNHKPGEPVSNEKIEPYKPFSSSLQRSLGPFASSYSKDKTPATPNTVEKPAPSNLSLAQKSANSKVPLLTRQITPEKLLDATAINKQIAAANLKNLTLNPSGLQSTAKTTPPASKTINRLSSSSLQSNSNSPDLVSSCAPAIKSPDVVNNAGNTPVSKLSGVNQGVILKPTLQAAPPIKPTLQTQKSFPSNPPKPLVKQVSKPNVTLVNGSDAKTVLRSAPPPPAGLADKKKSAPARPALPKVIQNNVTSNSSSNSSSKSNSFDKSLTGVSSKSNVSAKPVAKSVTNQKNETAVKNQSTVLPSKPSLSSKVSNVANLQQKFEASKIGQGARVSAGLKK